MMTFFSLFLQVLALTALPLVAAGLAGRLLQISYYKLCGRGKGRPFLLFGFFLSVPIREIAHLAACFLFCHRVEDHCLFLPPDGEGDELGFVDHSYNPKNPFALLGNFFFAVAPVLLGLFAVFLVVICCFRGVFFPFAEEIFGLRAEGAAFSAYVSATVNFLPTLFTGGTSGVFSRVIGCFLLLAVSLGVSVSLKDLEDAFSGVLVYLLLCAVFSAALTAFDARLAGPVLAGLSAFAASVTALALPALSAGIALCALGVPVYLFRRGGERG